MNIWAVESFEKLEVLPQDFTQEVVQIAPTRKVKRWFISKKYTDLLEKMYT